QMLDPSVIAGRRSRGVGAKLHHKDPITRQRRLGWGHNLVLRCQERRDTLDVTFWSRSPRRPLGDTPHDGGVYGRNRPCTIANPADVDTAQSMYPSIIPRHAHTRDEGVGLADRLRLV